MSGLMPDRYRDLIDKLSIPLIRDLHLDEEFYACMREDGSMSEAMHEQLEIEFRLKGRKEAVSYFLKQLKSRPEKAFWKFQKALRETQQPHLLALFPDDAIVLPTEYETVDSGLTDLTKYTEDTNKDLTALKIHKMSEPFKNKLISRDDCYLPLKSQSQHCKVIIVNNYWFIKRHEERIGADQDMKNLYHLFGQYPRVTIVPPVERKPNDKVPGENLSAEEIVKFLRDESQKPDLESTDVLIVVLMSHGRRNEVFGSDAKPVRIDPTILDIFSKDNCPLMANKPKFFIIQACQGGEQPAEENSRLGKLPPDMFVAMATVEGSVAYRHPVGGSWFIRAVVCVLTEYSHKHHVSTMLETTRSVVNKLKTTKGEIQLSASRESAEKYFYLFS